MSQFCEEFKTQLCINKFKKENDDRRKVTINLSPEKSWRPRSSNDVGDVVPMRLMRQESMNTQVVCVWVKGIFNVSCGFWSS